MKFNILKRLKDNKISSSHSGGNQQGNQRFPGYETFGANTGTVLGNIGLITMLCPFLVLFKYLFTLKHFKICEGKTEETNDFLVHINSI